jgi:hypothetical protein
VAKKRILNIFIFFLVEKLENFTFGDEKFREFWEFRENLEGFGKLLQDGLWMGF